VPGAVGPSASSVQLQKWLSRHCFGPSEGCLVGASFDEERQWPTQKRLLVLVDVARLHYGTLTRKKYSIEFDTQNLPRQRRSS